MNTASDDQRGIESAFRGAQRGAIAVEPPAAGAGAAQAADEADAAVAEAMKMQDAFVGGAAIVHFHEVGCESGHRAREQDDRHARVGEGAPQRGRHAAGRFREDHAVDAFGEEQAQVQLFLLRVVVAAGDQERVAGGVRRIFGAAHDLGKERIRDVRDDHAERLRALFREAARQQVRLVAEGGDRGLDARLQVGADERAVVEDGGHRGQGHARAPGHVVDVRHRTFRGGHSITLETLSSKALR